MISKREQLQMGMPLYGLSRRPSQEPSDYQPKHMKQYESTMSHCCFSGCTPMGCPGGCCVQEMGHRADCPLNPFREMDQAEHDWYVSSGRREHLAPPPAKPLCCVSCGDVIGSNIYGNGSCGPSGCLNRPA